MAKCAICEKGAHFGNNVSHSHRRSSKMWKSNVKSVRVKTDWICIWRMYDSELLSELLYNQAGVSMPDYRAALVVKALEIEYNIFNV